jgi:2-C-methyl-D-erythritol 4-phosphate cytidylyltransferase/2-C-methyl-D-erythritol 2,4-cyclodiphosphate synthase
VLERTLATFQDCGVDSIVVVANAEECDRVREACLPFRRVAAVVAGGETRAESVRNGLNALPPHTEIVLVHDAARPLVSSKLIRAIIEATARVGAAVPGTPLSDTVKRVDTAGLVRATVPRSADIAGQTFSGLTAVQTPQGARLALLRAAYERLDFAHAALTDEASLIEALGEPVAVVPGEPTNIKITHQEDLNHANMLLRHLAPPETRTGLGYDVHAFAAPEAGRKLFLGGVEIPHDRGLEGHSDADVLLHAVCDALLGAASLGDIGILFPNTDPTYKGISSLRLLSIVGERVGQAGWRIVNIDAAVVAEAPKLMPHRPAMQQAMAECLDIEPERISVKATTAEKLGFIGRREGIECTAIATLCSR